MFTGYVLVVVFFFFHFSSVFFSAVCLGLFFFCFRVALSLIHVLLVFTVHRLYIALFGIFLLS